MIIPVIQKELTPKQVRAYKKQIDRYKKSQYVDEEYLRSIGYETAEQARDKYFLHESALGWYKKQVNVEFSTNSNFKESVVLNHMSGMIRDNKAECVRILIQCYHNGITKQELAFMEIALNL